MLVIGLVILVITILGGLIELIQRKKLSSTVIGGFWFAMVVIFGSLLLFFIRDC